MDDLKSAVQTSALSKRWRYVWTSSLFLTSVEASVTGESSMVLDSSIEASLLGESKGGWSCSCSGSRILLWFSSFCMVGIGVGIGITVAIDVADN
ncbi:hypothetical protein LOK49_LG12G01361 [Camellia lanceoleosa]|uniref:Uncharacterized protein n=1 Tax=Camellia lanceoleosa TaxID=1840588 RepID=A0ACC0FQD3_9ERIC|nr:hypothetical protein LOK49_LG12G01361 [Camellia lanceoleosa]